MSTHGGSSPKQFKASIGSFGNRRPRQRPRSKKHREPEPIETRLLRNPSPKAAAAYTPRNELEDSRLRFQIHHYVTIVAARTVTPVGPRFEWYPLAVRDEAFFHAVISATCAHSAYMQKVERPSMFYYHRGIAIRLVNERIATGAHDEGTINAICVFAQHECWMAQPSNAETHMRGLVQIVEAAGGVRSPRLSQKTLRHLYFTDLAVSLTVDVKPILPPSVDLSDIKKYLGPPSAATIALIKTFGTRFYNFTGSGLSDYAATVLWGLRNLSELVDAIHEERAFLDTVSPTDIQFSDQVEVLERLVHRLWYVEDANSPQHTIFRTFGWTCLIYIYIVLRDLFKELGMMAMLAKRVKLALENCAELNVLLATFPDLMLWQMFTCGRVAAAREKWFFAQQATKILMVRKTEDASDILKAAESFLWPEKQTRNVASGHDSGMQYPSN